MRYRPIHIGYGLWTRKIVLGLGLGLKGLSSFNITGAEKYASRFDYEE